MKIKQTVIRTCLAIGVLTILVTSFGSVAFAASADCSKSNEAQCCAGVETSIIHCSNTGGATTAKDSGVWALLLMALKIMTAGVGVVAVGGIVYGSILYTTAADKAEQTKKAIGVITNVVIGIIAYGLMFLVLNFLIPGGLFNA
jgi:hypothetical protein